MDEVKEFLLTHRDIEATMLVLRSNVSKVFGDECEIVLEVQTDHTEGYQSLIARVMFDGEPEEVLDLLDRVGKNWWYAANRKFHGELVMDVGFV